MSKLTVLVTVQRKQAEENSGSALCRAMHLCNTRIVQLLKHCSLCCKAAGLIHCTALSSRLQQIASTQKGKGGDDEAVERRVRGQQG